MIEFLADMESGLREGAGDSLDRIQQTGTDIDITTILYFVYATAAVVAVGFIVYGGIQYTTTQGDPGKIRQAGQTLAFAIIGLIVVLLATVFTNFIFKSV